MTNKITALAAAREDSRLRIAPQHSKQAFTVEEFIAAFNVGRTKSYEEMSTGRLKTYKVGRRRYISVSAATAWQKSLERHSASEGGSQ